MASTSGCSHQLKDLQLSDNPFAATTSANEAVHATASTSYFSAVEEQIDRSKAHWSTLANHSGDTDEEEEVNFEMSNEQEFQDLQRHHPWGGFFGNFTGDGRSVGSGRVHGKLMVGKKFAEGGQAEIYEAQIEWNDPRTAEIVQRLKVEYVLKVFKEGTLLKHVKSQLPKALLLHHVEKAERIEYTESPTPKDIPYYNASIFGGILLKGGRFAFLMQRLHFDLRTLIERYTKLRGGEDCGPFSKEKAELLMYNVALGVNWLHNRDIVHRDLKASNVLIHEDDQQNWSSHVADYECSIGVIGTRFFRAPEILQVCKERKVNERPEVFSKAADVYSYGMICYEILTGKLPFEDHPLSDNNSLIDLVINQHLRPELPEYIEDWTHDLVGGCWQFDPTARPKIGEILNILATNSIQVKRGEAFLKKRYGENFKN